MSLLKRHDVKVHTEMQILTGLIVSDTFCRDIARLIGNETIETPYISRVVRWCMDYYGQYKKSPGNNINNIFAVEKEKIAPVEKDIIEALLKKLSDEYEISSINEDYYRDEALKLINARARKFAAEQSLALTELGRHEEADEIIQKYRRVSIETSGWEDPFKPDVIRNHYSDEQLKKNFLFSLPGEFGRFIGPFERNWLVGILAPAKRGKSFWLIEMALQAVFQRKKVIFISLEMNRQRIRRRIFRRLTAQSLETQDYIYPIFDCLRNQENLCNKSERLNTINMRLLDSEGNKPTYTRDLEYRNCDLCRGTKDFVPATWFTTRKVEKMSYRKATRVLDSQVAHFGYNQNLGSNFRLIDYPAFSANLSRVRGDIMNLIDTCNFIPDAIFIDYADILAPEDARTTGRDRIDETWKTLKRMTDELHCDVFTASQSNRGSFDKKNVVQTDAAEDIRKIANSDLFLAINQTAAEKRESKCRIAKIASRDESFDQYSSVIVLQQLALGQTCLDSYM